MLSYMKKYLSILGELIIDEPWRDHYHFPKSVFQFKAQVSVNRNKVTCLGEQIKCAIGCSLLGSVQDCPDMKFQWSRY